MAGRSDTAAVSDDAPIPYLQRTRDWYLALGYADPYRYGQFDAVPFQPLRKPLADCVLTLVTTAAPSDANCWFPLPLMRQRAGEAGSASRPASMARPPTAASGTRWSRTSR